MLASEQVDQQATCRRVVLAMVEEPEQVATREWACRYAEDHMVFESCVADFWSQMSEKT